MLQVVGVTRTGVQMSLSTGGGGGGNSPQKVRSMQSRAANINPESSEGVGGRDLDGER